MSDACDLDETDLRDNALTTSIPSLAQQPVLAVTSLSKRYGGVLGLPLTFLIDAHGKIVARYLGGADLSAVEAQIKHLLAH